jgi:hypothetical protein
MGLLYEYGTIKGVRGGIIARRNRITRGVSWLHEITAPSYFNRKQVWIRCTERQKMTFKKAIK